MLKPIFLASAMMISAPVLAQDMPAQVSTTTMPSQTAPATPDTAVPSDPVTPEGDVPATPEGDVSAAESMTTDAPAQSAEAPAAPAQASPTQIAEVVEAEFPTYDKDADGEITQAEFGQWMVALRSASDPGTDAQSAEVQTWVNQAFASADTDQSGNVSKAELTSFLSQGAS